MGKKKNKKKSDNDGQIIKSTINPSDSKNRVVLIGLLIPLLLGGAYVIGNSYYQGLLHGQGFSDMHFPVSVDEKYLMAYYAIVFFLFKSIEPLANFWTSILKNIDWGNIAVLVILSIAIHVAFRLIEHQKKINKERKEKFEPVFQKLKYTKLITEPFITFGIMYSLMIFSLIPLALLLYLSGVFLWPHAIGLKQGLEIKDNFLENGCMYEERTQISECVDIINSVGQTVITGKIVVQHNRTIGIIDATTMSSVVYELKLDDKIERKNMINKNVSK